MAFQPIVPTNAPRPSSQKKPTKKDELLQTAQAEREALEAERIYRTGVVNIRDIIAPAAFKVESSYVLIGEVYARTIFVVKYPRYNSVGWF